MIESMTYEYIILGLDGVLKERICDGCGMLAEWLRSARGVVAECLRSGCGVLATCAQRKHPQDPEVERINSRPAPSGKNPQDSELERINSRPAPSGENPVTDEYLPLANCRSLLFLM